MEIKQEWLQNFKTFLLQYIKLSGSDFNAVKNILRPVYLSKGELFVGFKREPIRCGFIIKGLLRTYFITENGEEYIKVMDLPLKGSWQRRNLVTCMAALDILRTYKLMFSSLT